MSRRIDLFVPKFDVEACLSEVRECLEAGWTGAGFKTDTFEQAWREYTGLPHAHFLSSATAGLHLALHVLRSKERRWPDGDEVITTPFTFVSTNHAILYERLTPVFADIDDTLCLDVDSIRARITSKTRAVMFVGVAGSSGRLADVADLCREHGLALILDAAHMAGTRVAGAHVGADVAAAVFSFHSVKNLPSADGGMVCFAREEDDLRARRLSWLGIDKTTYERTRSESTRRWFYDVDEVGFKYHGNSIMAAIGLVQLRHLDADNDLRRDLAARYRERLAPSRRVRLIPVPDSRESSTHLFQVRVRNRDELIAGLNRRDIYPGVHYRDNTEFAPYRYAHGSCPNAARASAEVASLPLHLRMSEADVDRVAAAVIEIAD